MLYIKLYTDSDTFILLRRVNNQNMYTCVYSL